jgi:putative endonuclease
MFMLGTLLDFARDIARRRHWNPDKALGRRGEDLAHRFLRRQGYTIVARNYRLASGAAEADLVARDGDALVFVEVKTRRDAGHGPPERAMSPEKHLHLRRVAREYARKASIPIEQARGDLVTVVLSDPPEIQLVRNAFRI